MHILTVNTAGHGMKLIAFLSRRLGGTASSGDLHRWIRTGQVRVNGKRAKAFDKICAGDDIRLPPFAAPGVLQAAETIEIETGEDLGGGLRVIAATDDFLALEKPSGLPAQPGSGQRTSAAKILRDRFAGATYIPAPAHRLDKNTSGILLAGRTHEAQKTLHALFARHDDASVTKTYLAWVQTIWPNTSEQTLVDNLSKEAAGHPGDAAFERMRVVEAGRGKEGRCRVTLLETRETGHGAASLLRVILETGRTHQIRIQLASRGFPVIGDGKYGAKRFGRMLLHAHALTFPWRGGTFSIVSQPDWPAPFAVAQSPLHTI